ncbi:MAG: very short patch repair endonuclease [Flavobacteriales bacterium]|nr:very short patch repair endonuclease [Flavobacteriales bacterium]
MSKVYLRDGRAPIPKDARTSATMSRIRSRNTGPERMMRAALSAEGIRGYRLNWKKAPGRPDIAWPKRKVAVFVHGCFWHLCPHCQRNAPKRNSMWWKKKLAANQARDQRKLRELRKDGWRAVTVWECQLKKDTPGQVARVLRLLDQ